ncbi:fructose-specific PTS transporter subunit EIIC [Corynebacterium uberis]|uniref:fructose-specific PTS transporter subunit EIIC n=1 Tax=Corynebacterium TaxID=1716 RepID=UPI001D09C1B4|nr:MULTISPECIES: fructose-specific PTS transporter subunit EIIC [Corynebacterium]MCZ9309696.1 fructose-specific PTS transporter subunit EIIC [Corynebacterium sp. c6VSa_13]UDL73500.1 fructose-specific PTS transporter subunit EIIC [Corynebacterium uberis]UDL75620.1 fructose-specific PTS transporter subunit EIIC [Corynebacterium uberis]UDL77833.1 fructose-specific PTS transporter subunit EIIC [Corynebacterium uberis]UDL80116.1 fructose-specific PTS transporter subunit EIIC [Corynebacterium uberis
MTLKQPLVLAITACPTGIAHTYMAAEKLQQAAAGAGVEVRVETHGSIGVEGTFTDAELEAADAVLIAADTVIDKARFAGLRVLSVPVDAAIKDPGGLLRRTLEAPVQQAGAGTADQAAQSSAPGMHVGQLAYRGLMNGVSHMIPFVVTGGLLLAVALSVGGQPTEAGLVIPEGSFWHSIEQIGVLAFGLMVPVLSAYIAAGIADRPGLAPGFITGMIAVTGSLYGSQAGAGFIGGIITGMLSGVVALGIRKIPVGKFVAPIWPIIVIPIITTLVVGLAFIYVIGHPLASLFEGLTTALQGMDEGSVVIVGAVLGAMIAFDMGGPFNKTAFLFGGGLIAAGNPHPMGMVAAAIAVPPLAVGLATLLRRGWFNKAERDSGVAALLMGFFGITEGAIPLAASRPLQVIPANVIGGAVAGALAGVWGATDHVMHGGPIVAVLGAVDNVVGFFAAMGCGVAVTTVLVLVGAGISRRRHAAAAPQEQAQVPVLSPQVVLLDAPATSQESVVAALIEAAAAEGRIGDARDVGVAVARREQLSSTAVGDGVAIPHARTAGVTAATLAVARLKEPGVEWDAPDGAAVRVVFLIVVPADAGKQHLAVLARLAKALTRTSLREDVLAAQHADEVVERLRAVLEPEPAQAQQA